MSTIVTVSGSPSPGSRSARLAAHVGARLQARGFDVLSIDVRDLPADALVNARADVPAIRDAVGAIERADGVVFVTPVYKAAYSGVLKVFLDLLPQFALRGKAVLPLATGGTLAHVLAIDYALRPVLSSLAPLTITTGLFLLDKLIDRDAPNLIIDSDLAKRLDDVVGELARAVEGLADRNA